jgi:hypothetical protein
LGSFIVDMHEDAVPLLVIWLSSVDPRFSARSSITSEHKEYIYVFLTNNQIVGLVYFVTDKFVC